jgi:methanogenic corrinoid protein MtbC1
MENSHIEDIAELLVATYARTGLRRMFGGIKVNEKWR